MIKKILIIGIASTLFTGCASQVKIEKISNKRIGYSSPIGYESNLCHGYTGITVFQKTGTKHELSSSISKMYQDALELGIKNTGNTPVYLGELSLINNSEYAKFSEWDHSIALTDNGKRYLNKKIKDENIDYIIIPREADDDKCSLSVTTGKGEYNGKMAMMWSQFKIYLLRNSESEISYILNRRGGGQSHSETYEPANLKELSDADLKKYEELFNVGMAEDVVQLLNGELHY